MRFSIKLVGLLAATAYVAACGSSSEPRLTGPATLAVDTAGPTTATVGTSIHPVPVFVVKDSNQRPLPNVVVTFFGSFGSTVTPSTVSTDANGRARPTSWVLPQRTGSASLSATAINGTLTAASITTLLAGPAVAVSLSTNTFTLALTDTIPLNVTAVDAFQNLVTNPNLTFTSSNPAVVSISGNKLIAHTQGDATITVSITGQNIATSASVSVVARFGGLAGRPFGITFVHGTTDLFLVTSQDVHSLTSVNATTFAKGSAAPVGANPPDVVANAQGTLAYVTSIDGAQVTIVNLPAMTVAQTIPDQTTARVLLSPDGSLLYVGKEGGIDVFSTSTRALVSSVSIGSLVNGMALSTDGSTLWASTTFSGQLYRINTSNMTITNSLTLGGTPQEVVYHAGSGNVYVANESGWVDVVRGADLSSVTRFQSLAGAFGMVLSADQNTLYVAGAYAGKVYVVDRASGTINRTITVGGLPRRMTRTGDGHIAVANESAYVSLVQ